MRRLPPLNALKAFEAAARHESLTTAAEELRVTHSAIGQHVKQLEEFFRQPLFTKQGRRLKLTPHARAYLEDVRTCFDRLALASERFAESTRRRIIRVNSTPSFAMRWLIPRLSSFQLKNPGIEVRMTTSVSDSIDHLDAGYDVIIRRDRMSRPSYICQRFLDDVSTAVASPNFAGIETVRSPSQLLNMPLLHMRSRPDAWVRWFRAAEVPVTETLSGPFYDHFFLSLQAAITRLGVALAPRVLIEDDLATGRLKFVLPHIAVEGAGFFALFRARLTKDLELDSFFAWLTSQSAGRIARLNG
jgi:LysR family transcriptional regulator, glycine cleavage system transcriptional activator